MRHALIGGLAGLLAVGGVSAQIVVPPMPKKLITRPIGGGTTGGVEVAPHDGATETKVRYTTRIVLSDERQWTSSEGKPLFAKLIAFDDQVVEMPKGAAQAGTLVPPPNPTVVRDGRIRLVANKKTFELALDRLSQADRDFVEQIRAARAKKPDAPKP
jgi:hypothetical protein